MFKKGRERRHIRREIARRYNRRHPSNEDVGVANGTEAVATGAYKISHQDNEAIEETEVSSTAMRQSNSGYDSASSSESDFEDGFEIKHLSEYTCLEVQFFMNWIG